VALEDGYDTEAPVVVSVKVAVAELVIIAPPGLTVQVAAAANAG
jgi:hypothetical protein